MDLGLQNKVSIVTGGTRGIGYSICQDLLGEGVIVCGLYRGSISKFDPLKQWMIENAVPEQNFLPLCIDITSTVDLEEGVALIFEKYKRIDILVNCAGITHEAPFLMTDESQWTELLNTNLLAVMNLTKLVLRHMFPVRSGSIINISSLVASRFGRGVVAYAASKAAVNRFSETLAMEVGKKGIRVNCISPGIIETSMSSNLLTVQKSIAEQSALKRIGRTDEISKAVLFLASDKTASFITGHNLIIDGGMSI